MARRRTAYYRYLGRYLGRYLRPPRPKKPWQLRYKPKPRLYPYFGRGAYGVSWPGGYAQPPDWFAGLPTPLQQIAVQAGIGQQGWLYQPAGIFAPPAWASRQQALGSLGFLMPTLAPLYLSNLMSLAIRGGLFGGDLGAWSYQGRAELYSQFAAGAFMGGRPGAGLGFLATQAYWELQQQTVAGRLFAGIFKIATFASLQAGLYRAFGFPFIGAAQNIAVVGAQARYINLMMGLDPNAAISTFLETPARGFAYQYPTIDEWMVSSLSMWTGAQVGVWGVRAGIESALQTGGAAGAGFRFGFMGRTRGVLGFSLMQPGLDLLMGTLGGMTARQIAGLPISRNQDEFNQILGNIALGGGLTAAGLGFHLWQARQPIQGLLAQYTFDTQTGLQTRYRNVITGRFAPTPRQGPWFARAGGFTVGLGGFLLGAGFPLPGGGEFPGVGGLVAEQLGYGPDTWQNILARFGAGLGTAELARYGWGRLMGTLGARGIGTAVLPGMVGAAGTIAAGAIAGVAWGYLGAYAAYIIGMSALAFGNPQLARDVLQYQEYLAERGAGPAAYRSGAFAAGFAGWQVGAGQYGLGPEVASILRGYATEQAIFRDAAQREYWGNIMARYSAIGWAGRAQLAGWTGGIPWFQSQMIRAWGVQSRIFEQFGGYAGYMDWRSEFGVGEEWYAGGLYGQSGNIWKFSQELWARRQRYFKMGYGQYGGRGGAFQELLLGNITIAEFMEMGGRYPAPGGLPGMQEVWRQRWLGEQVPPQLQEAFRLYGFEYVWEHFRRVFYNPFAEAMGFPGAYMFEDMRDPFKLATGRMDWRTYVRTHTMPTGGPFEAPGSLYQYYYQLSIGGIPSTWTYAQYLLWIRFGPKRILFGPTGRYYVFIPGTEEGVTQVIGGVGGRGGAPPRGGGVPPSNMNVGYLMDVRGFRGWISTLESPLTISLGWWTTPEQFFSADKKKKYRAVETEDFRFALPTQTEQKDLRSRNLVPLREAARVGVDISQRPLSEARKASLIAGGSIATRGAFADVGISVVGGKRVGTDTTTPEFGEEVV